MDRPPPRNLHRSRGCLRAALRSRPCPDRRQREGQRRRGGEEPEERARSARSGRRVSLLGGPARGARARSERAMRQGALRRLRPGSQLPRELRHPGEAGNPERRVGWEERISCRLGRLAQWSARRVCGIGPAGRHAAGVRHAAERRRRPERSMGTQSRARQRGIPAHLDRSPEHHQRSLRAVGDRQRRPRGNEYAPLLADADHASRHEQRGGLAGRDRARRGSGHPRLRRRGDPRFSLSLAWERPQRIVLDQRLPAERAGRPGRGVASGRVRRGLDRFSRFGATDLWPEALRGGHPHGEQPPVAFGRAGRSAAGVRSSARRLRWRILASLRGRDRSRPEALGGASHAHARSRGVSHRSGGGLRRPQAGSQARRVSGGRAAGDRLARGERFGAGRGLSAGADVELDGPRAGSGSGRSRVRRGADASLDRHGRFALRDLLAGEAGRLEHLDARDPVGGESRDRLGPGGPGPGAGGSVRARDRARRGGTRALRLDRHAVPLERIRYPLESDRAHADGGRRDSFAAAGPPSGASCPDAGGTCDAESVLGSAGDPGRGAHRSRVPASRDDPGRAGQAGRAGL